MSNLARPLDPEFQRIYDEANKGRSSEPVAYDAEVVSAEAATEEDGFQVFARMANEQHAKNASKPKADIGTFDHFEQGVSNTIRLGWEWLTR